MTDSPSREVELVSPAHIVTGKKLVEDDSC